MEVEEALFEAAEEAVDSVGYLSSAVKLEPLVCRWPAWPQLLSMAPCALNIAFRILPQLQSFLQSPAVHLAASADPAMFGGPFLAVKESEIEQVRARVQDTVERCGRLVQFARDYRAFERQLRERATGGSLDELYAELPDTLRGIVELVYDLNNHPQMRVFNERFVEAGMDVSALQEICLHRVADQARPFFMSAPMLDRADRLIVPLKFSDPAWDVLAGLRHRPGSVAELARDLRLTAAQQTQLAGCLTGTPPTRMQPQMHAAGVRVRYFGHACVLIQSARCSVLIDPLTAWDRTASATLTFDDLPDFIDYVVITHAHPDHFVSELLIQLRSRVGRVIVPQHNRGSVADLSMAAVLRQLNFRAIDVVETFDRVELPDGFIWSLPFFGEHGDLDIAAKQCVAVSMQGHVFVLLADTDGIQAGAYRAVARELGRIDALFIGMECKGAPMSWLYGPLLTGSINRKHDDARRLSGSNSERAWQVARQFDCGQVFVYAMGQEPWLRHLMGLEYQPDAIQLIESDRFIARCRGEGVQAERLYGCREWHFDEER